MALIGFGTFKLYYSYIFLLVFFKFLSDYIEGFNEKDYYKKPNEESFTDFGSIFAYHPLLRDFMYFLGATCCGLILYIIYRKIEKHRRNDSVTLETIMIIQNNLFGTKNYFNFSNLLIISFIYSLNIILRTFLMSMKFDAGFWTLEILFVIFLTIRILKVKIGNHQKVTIFILSIILFSVQIANSLLPKTDHHCKDEECFDTYLNDNNMYIFMEKKFGNFGWIFLIFFLYIIDFMMRDYSWVKLKFLMDVKTIPIFKIMLFIGIVGCIIIFIIFIFVTAFPCNTLENITMMDGNYVYIDTKKNVDFSRQVCGLIDYNEEKKTLSFYYDSLLIFLKDYSESNRQSLEIGIIPIYFIINLFINFSQGMILKHLDPNAMLVNINFNYLLSRMITYIKNDANEEYLTVEEFVLLELCEILAIIAYMIYIELIELKFCRFDYDLKKTIEQRSIVDTRINLLDDIDSNENPDTKRDDKNLHDEEKKTDKIELRYKSDEDNLNTD